MPHQTFAEYLINKELPGDIKVGKPLEKKYLWDELLSKVAKNYPNKYDQVVSNLKRLGDKLSTWETSTIGLDEISPPNKKKRDEIIKRYQGLTSDSKNEDELISNLERFQDELQKHDTDPSLQDDASEMVRSALGGKKSQLMKLRTSPGVVKDHKGDIVNEIFDKSYSEGLDPLHYWVGATDARKKLAQGQLNTAAPGATSKVFANLMNSSVVSIEDCKTHRGITLPVKNADVVGRYLAAPIKGHSRNKEITSDVQQDLLRQGVEEILVRSPQTCAAKDNTVCKMCMGIRPGTSKPYKVGDNAGMIGATSISESLTQAALSSKHSTSLAKKDKDFSGFAAIEKFTEMPKQYSNKQILCEIYGEVYRIRPAAQGGKEIFIRLTRKVPERYIEEGKEIKNMNRHYKYYIPPNLKILDEIEKDAKVYPGQPLTDGHKNIKDIARLKNIGMARTEFADTMDKIYDNTGLKTSRVHFELLARNAHKYAKIVKAPPGFEFKRGEVVEYNKLEDALSKIPSRAMPVDSASGMTLTEPVLDLTAGTELEQQAINRLKQSGVKTVKATNQVEIEPHTTPASRVVNQSQDWMSAMNHRYLQNQIKDAATLGKKSNIHGYNPISSYAYGTEMRQDEYGRY